MMVIPRSVRRYRSGLAWLGGLTGLCVSLGILVTPGDAKPRSDATSSVPPGPQRIGMNSCAARGCHGAVEAVDPVRGESYIKDGAYTTWLNFDPHARAYDVLHEPRSQKIYAKLKGPLAKGSAHESALCLACHATSSPSTVAPLRDGIDCEGCHGPAERWNDKHLATAWRAQPAGVKAVDGLTDLSTPGAQAKTCVACHVGDRSRGMDVNHDLIAAGHPRLNFEFASYLASYPKHWKDHGPVEAKSWAIGQVVTAESVLELLVDRARESKPGAVKHPSSPDAIWPEFSEYECFACHHGLVKSSPLQVAGHPFGRTPWATWSTTMLPVLSDKPVWDDLSDQMATANPDPDLVIKLAEQKIQELKELRVALEKDPFDANRVALLLKDVGGRKPVESQGWDRLAQHYLASLALTRASKGLGLKVEAQVEESIQATSKLLEFPEDYDSPRQPASVSRPKSLPKP